MKEVPRSRPEEGPSLEKAKLELATTEVIEHLAEVVPEIAENYDTITTNCQIITELAGIESGFFEKIRPNHLILAGLALHLEEVKKHAGKSPAEFEKGMAFIENTARLLAWDNAKDFDTLAKQHNLLEGGSLEVFAPYIDPELTAQLEAKIIDDDLLGDVRDKLELTAETERPVRFHVLDITYDPKTPEDQAKLEKFTAVTHRPNAFGGTALENEGTTHLMLTKETLRLFLEEPDPHDWYYRSAVRYVRQTIEHEYTHSQPPFLDIGTGTPMIFEELRATYGASKNSYRDLQMIANSLEVVTGFSIKDEIEKAQTSGHESQFFYNFANHLGLENTLLFTSMNMPGRKLDSPLYQDLSKYVGTYDDFIKNMYEMHVNNPQQAKKIALRLTEFRAKKTHPHFPFQKSAFPFIFSLLYPSGGFETRHKATTEELISRVKSQLPTNLPPSNSKFTI